VSPTLVVELADNNLCLHHKPGACNITHETLHFRMSHQYHMQHNIRNSSMIVLDGGRNMLTGKEAEKVPEV